MDTNNANQHPNLPALFEQLINITEKPRLNYVPPQLTTLTVDKIDSGAQQMNENTAGAFS